MRRERPRARRRPHPARPYAPPRSIPFTPASRGRRPLRGNVTAGHDRPSRGRRGHDGDTTGTRRGRGSGHGGARRGLHLPGGQVTVEVETGVVTLGGEVARRSQVAPLLEAVREVDGVVDVRGAPAFRSDDLARVPAPYL
ncbi:BON domain-containing protein [Streptosporangium sp. NPDC050855]|uniref:BON domain-containing protein n=1 Tax=Streptosporangium sp. NPDC050855 TaxID=3366194 RepID=UPI00379B14B7